MSQRENKTSTPSAEWKLETSFPHSPVDGSPQIMRGAREMKPHLNQDPAVQPERAWLTPEERHPLSASDVQEKKKHLFLFKGADRVEVCSLCRAGHYIKNVFLFNLCRRGRLIVIQFNIATIRSVLKCIN